MKRMVCIVLRAVCCAARIIAVPSYAGLDDHRQLFLILFSDKIKPGFSLAGFSGPAFLRFPFSRLGNLRRQFKVCPCWYFTKKAK